MPARSHLFGFALVLAVVAGSFIALFGAGPGEQKQPGIGMLRFVTVAVRDHDEALAFYTQKLGFEKVADQRFGESERWLVVAPRGQQDLGIILYNNASGSIDVETFKRRVGGEINWVFHTGDCRRTCAEFADRGVRIIDEPREVPWGVQALFEDLYGNRFVLLEPRSPAPVPGEASRRSPASISSPASGQ